MPHSLAGPGFPRSVVVLTLHPVAPPGDQSRAAARTAELLRRTAGIARQQAQLAFQRAEITRAVAVSEQAEAALAHDPNHAAPRAQRVKHLTNEARVRDAEAATLERESVRLLAQGRTAEQRARMTG